MVTITYYEDLADNLALESIETDSADTIELIALDDVAAAGDRLRRDLDTSLAWIDNRDGAMGTLQILLLSKARFDPEAYYDHVSGMARGGMDVSQLKILETVTGGRETYSVVYGEYANRLAAARARDYLPAALRDSAPIARSIAGLRSEIRRLDGQN